MIRIVPILLIVIFTAASSEAQTVTIFNDDFDGTEVSSTLWHIPTWVSPTDGTYVGRTQFRCTQNASLPKAENGNAVINLETFNPTGFSFYGTDLISNRTFSPGNGLVFTFNAKIGAPADGGVVGGIFLYDLTGGGSNHDEADFELLTNRPSQFQTNIYSNEPLGAGHPQFESLTGAITDYHTYVIKWLPGKIIWTVDGSLVRTELSLVPSGPMHFHLNMWAPAADWAEAYDSNLQPVGSAASNQIYTLFVENVKVDSMLIADGVRVSEDNHNAVSFYPNPAHDIIYFTDPMVSNVTIYSTTGELVLNRKNPDNRSLQLSELKKGLYTMKFFSKGKESHSKLIIF